MARLEERVVYLEGQLVEQSNTFEAIRDVNAGLVREMQLLNAKLDREMQLLNAKVDSGVQMVHARLDREIHLLHARLDREMQLLTSRIDRLDKRFVWMFGMQVTTFVAIVVALFAR